VGSSNAKLCRHSTPERREKVMDSIRRRREIIDELSEDRLENTYVKTLGLVARPKMTSIVKRSWQTLEVCSRPKSHTVVSLVAFAVFCRVPALEHPPNTMF
jgi:hypothetical protein